MTARDKTPVLELRPAPHAHAGVSVEQIMRNVVLALTPICAFAVYQFGLSAAALIAVVTGTCLAAEWLFARLAGKSNPLGDWSATITGLLLALTLPPGFPLWMGAVAGIVAIGLGKALFGGLGFNIFNPALVGRAFVQAAFPAAITTWTPAFALDRFAGFIPSTLTLPLMHPLATSEWSKKVAVDAFSGATPLAAHKFERLLTPTSDLFLGLTAGSAGETSALLILLCGAYLAARRMMDWRIPAAVLGSAALASWAFHLADAARFPPPLFMLFSGGLMLGAVFMATDMVGSPVTPLGVWIYGALIGVVTILIRLFGGQSEGVMYAILLGNAASPLIDQFTQPRVFGERRRGEKP
jgi:electron transport complex protein RnfD